MQQRDRSGFNWEMVGAITAVAIACFAGVFSYAQSTSGAVAEINALKAASARHEQRFDKIEQQTERLSELLTGLRVDMAGLSTEIHELRTQLASRQNGSLQ